MQYSPNKDHQHHKLQQQKSWISSPDCQGAMDKQRWFSMEDPAVPLERNLYGHPSAGPLWERQFERVLLEHGWEKGSKLGMLIR